MHRYESTDQFQEGRDNRYITKTAKPYPVALALLFINTGSFDVAGVGEVWPSVANLKIDNKDPEYFNLTSLIQLFALADIWGLHNLKQPVQDGVLHWGLKKHQYEWPVEEVQDNEAFRPIVLNILKAIFANTTEGSSLRTLAVGRGSRLANPKLWHLNYYNASKDFEEEKLHWCESVRKFLEDEEPFALAACTVLYELC